MLKTLDVLLDILHISVIGANCFFWIFPKLRRIHRIIFALTSFSWLVLGAFYGIGYCFLTDIHWQIKRQLSDERLPASYISYLLDISGVGDPGEPYVSWLTGGVFAFIALVVIVQIIRKKP